MNYIDGTFHFWKTGGNVYDNVYVNLNCCYNVLEYYLESYGQGTDWKLVRCTYNGIQYYALKGYYHANPYTHVTFTGHIRSDLAGGNNTSTKSLNLPYAVAYYNYTSNSANAVVLNSEIQNSLTDTLTNTYVTSVSRRGLSNPGGFIGNATTAATLQTARTINGTSFNGSANITTANWGTARTLTIGNKGQSVDGSANVSWALQDILIRAGNEFNYTANGLGNLWFNYKTQTGTVATTAITGYYFGNGQGNSDGVTLHATAFSGNAATATRLQHITVNNTTLHNTAGTFAFSGNGDPWSGNDWVGFQIGDNVDKFQLIRVNSNNLLFRQNDSGGTNTSWGAWEKILTDVNTSWAAWTAGTTAGPQANLSLSGTNIQSAAIPSASASASGIVTTGAQQFKGRKKFGYLELYGEDAGTAKQYLDIIGRNNAGTQVAEIYYNFGNTTNITTGVWSFRQWSPNSTANTTTSGGYETYSLPTVTTGLSSGNHGYSILTTKNTVTVAQGGTGNTSYTADRLIYSESASKLSAHGSLIISTETTYASRTITPLLRVNGILMANTQIESAAYFMNNGTGTSGSHGYYLYRNNAQYARLFVSTVGTVATADAAGTAGVASLYLGNATAQPAAGATTAGANNAYGRILLYGTGTTYTILRSNPNGSRTIYLPHAGADGYLVCKTTTAAVGGTGTPVYVDANGVVQACTAYGSATAATANAIKTTLMTNASTAIYVLGTTGTAADTSATVYKGYRTSTAKVYFRGDTGVLMGAAWNDYAEYRQAKNDIEIEPGRVVKEVGDETLELTTERLQRGCSIVSNTFGISIGESNINKLPLAVSGRVLAYPYEDREEFKNHIGWPVCSGPNGTVSIMTEEEEIKYPSRIIGIISAVPDYEIWHGGADVIVDGRVWIKVR